MARIYLDKSTARLTRTDVYLVTVTMTDGTVIENLEPRRLFPVTNGSKYITLLDANEREVCFVRDIADLDRDSAAALLACFAEYYRVPQIVAVLEVTEKFGTISWRVRTDRGEVTFRIRNRHSDIKCFSDNRVLIRDSNDNRYEIGDHTRLDLHSRRLLFPYL